VRTRGAQGAAQTLNKKIYRFKIRLLKKQILFHQGGACHAVDILGMSKALRSKMKFLFFSEFKKSGGAESRRWRNLLSKLESQHKICGGNVAWEKVQKQVNNKMKVYVYTKTGKQQKKNQKNTQIQQKTQKNTQKQVNNKMKVYVD
jgi:hypothetical protein